MEDHKITDKRKPDSLPKWIKCSEQMPPMKLKIITKINGRLVENAGQGVMLYFFLDLWDVDRSCVEWTPCTEDF